MRKRDCITGIVAAAFCACLASCFQFDDPGDVTGPEDPGSLIVVASASPSSVFEGGFAEVSAAPAGGLAPYRVRWDQNGGPDDVDIDDPALASFTVGPFDDVGLYVLRVTVTDAQGRHNVDYAQIQVLSAVEASAPAFAVVGAPEAISATLTEAPAGTEVLWEVTSGDATIAAPQAETTTITANAPGTIDLRLTVTIPGAGSESIIEREFEIAAAGSSQPRVLVETSLGDFTLELEGLAAPNHAANFLLYVDDGFYEGLLIHRVVCRDAAGDAPCEPFVIQGGGFVREGEEIVEVDPTRDPVNSESDNGLTNGELYTVALALRGGDPNSGSTQFFVNLDDNSFLDEDGFTVFATVISGRDVVDAIAQVETQASPVIPGEQSLPVDDILIERISRIMQ
jgi:cyclophilin family peptidyl-prolyl cis-trans isomerase